MMPSRHTLSYLSLSSLSLTCLIVLTFALQGCSELGFEKSLGFVRERPNEFETVPNPQLIIPPNISDLPTPEYQEYQGGRSKSFVASELATADAPNSNAPEALVAFLLSNPNIKTNDVVFDAQIYGLLYLPPEIISTLQTHDSFTARGITITGTK